MTETSRMVCVWGKKKVNNHVFFFLCMVDAVI